MKTVFAPLTIVAIMTILPTLTADGQELQQRKKNWIGTGLFLDLTNGSATTGLLFERKLHQVGRAVFGLRTGWYLPHRSGNISLNLGGSSNTGYGKNYRITLVPILATAQLSFTNNPDSKFLLLGAFGGMYSRAKKIRSSTTGEHQYSNFLAGGELGLGMQASLSKNTNAVVAFTLSRFNAQQNPTDSKLPLVLASLSFAVGF